MFALTNIDVLDLNNTQTMLSKIKISDLQLYELKLFI